LEREQDIKLRKELAKVLSLSTVAASFLGGGTLGFLPKRTTDVGVVLISSTVNISLTKSVSYIIRFWQPSNDYILDTLLFLIQKIDTNVKTLEMKVNGLAGDVSKLGDRCDLIYSDNVKKPMNIWSRENFILFGINLCTFYT
jgi:hypothetical protein